MELYERLDRSVPVIGVVRSAARGERNDSTRWSTLQEIIAQPSGTSARTRSGIAQSVSRQKIGRAERTSASRQSRDAARALTTGWVALAWEDPSQGRRSLSRIPASVPQGFCRWNSISFDSCCLRRLARGRRSVLTCILAGSKWSSIPIIRAV